MAEKAGYLEEALSLALRLSPADRLRFVERVVSSVRQELDVPPLAGKQSQEHRAQALNKQPDEVGSIELVNPEITDPVE